jgi:hypothetical protein
VFAYFRARKTFPFARRTAGHKLWPESVAAVHSHYNGRCLPPLQLDHNFLFGFAYFRQVKDPTIRRGYYQKSVILLSYLPLVSFFSQITTLVANKFFENGELPLEIFCHDVDRWPRPNPGITLWCLPESLSHAFTPFEINVFLFFEDN